MTNRQHIRRMLLPTASILVFGIVTMGCKGSDAEDRRDEVRAVDGQPYNLAPAHCKIDWANFETQFPDLDESCIEFMPTPDEARASIVDQGLDPEPFEDDLVGFAVYHALLAEQSDELEYAYGLTADVQNYRDYGEEGGLLEDYDAAPEYDIGNEIGDISSDIISGLDDNLDLDLSFENPDVTTGLSCEYDSVSGNVAFDVDVPFNGTYGGMNVYNGCIARCRSIYARAKFNGNAHINVGGTISGSPSHWMAMLSGSIVGSVYADVSVSMTLTGLFRQTFHVGNADVNASLSAQESFTITYDCLAGRYASPHGRPSVSAPVNVNVRSFKGVVFPRMRGPYMTRVRTILRPKLSSILTQKAQSIVNSKIKGIVDQYMAKKNAAIDKLLANLNGKEPCEECVDDNGNVVGQMADYATESEAGGDIDEAINMCSSKYRNHECTMCCSSEFPSRGSSWSQCLSQARCGSKPK